MERSCHRSSVYRGDKQKHVCEEHSCVESVLTRCHHSGRRKRYCEQTQSSSIRPMRVWRQSEATMWCEALIMLQSCRYFCLSRVTARRSGRGEWPMFSAIAISTTASQGVLIWRKKSESISPEWQLQTEAQKKREYVAELSSFGL